MLLVRLEHANTNSIIYDLGNHIKGSKSIELQQSIMSEIFKIYYLITLCII